MNDINKPSSSGDITKIISRSRIITGIRADIIRSFIVINIGILALKHSKSVTKGVRLISNIRKKRKSIQGLQKINKLVKSNSRYFFSENFPGWPSKAFNGFFGKEIIRASGLINDKPNLHTIIFAITSKCRLRCKHCFEWDNLSSEEYLSVDELKEVVSKIKKIGINHIQFSGGEPLERYSDLLELLRYSKKGTDLWLLTSGFGLDFERALQMKEAGLSGAVISLDHWDESAHNSFRNSDKSFFWVKEAVRNCNRAGLATCLSVCATRTFVTHENLTKYASLAREWGVGFVRILEPRDSGKFKGMDVALNSGHIKLLEEFYQDLNSSDKYLDYPIVTYPGYHQHRVGCFGAGNRFLYIDSQGDIHACPFCQGAVGNVTIDDIEESVLKLKERGCHKYEMDFSE